MDNVPSTCRELNVKLPFVLLLIVECVVGDWEIEAMSQSVVSLSYSSQRKKKLTNYTVSHRGEKSLGEGEFFVFVFF